MKHLRTGAVAAVLGSLLLAGCGGVDTEPKKEPMPMEETVYGGQIQQMNKVREETKKMEGRMDDLNKQLENNGE